MKQRVIVKGETMYSYGETGETMYFLWGDNIFLWRDNVFLWRDWRTIYSYVETGGQCIPMEQGCPEGVIGGSPLESFVGKNIKVKLSPPLEFWKFSELAP